MTAPKSSPPGSAEAAELLDEVLGVPGARLERDAGCRRGLSWACCFLEVSPEALVRALSLGGFEDGSRLKGLVELTLPGRHRLVIVPATGRVQLRLDAATPPSDRQAVASRVATWIAAQVRQPGATSGTSLAPRS